MSTNITYDTTPSLTAVVSSSPIPTTTTTASTAVESSSASIATTASTAVGSSSTSIATTLSTAVETLATSIATTLSPEADGDMDGLKLYLIIGASAGLVLIVVVVTVVCCRCARGRRSGQEKLDMCSVSVPPISVVFTSDVEPDVKEDEDVQEDDYDEIPDSQRGSESRRGSDSTLQSWYTKVDYPNRLSSDMSSVNSENEEKQPVTNGKIKTNSDSYDRVELHGTAVVVMSDEDDYSHIDTHSGLPAIDNYSHIQLHGKNADIELLDKPTDNARETGDDYSHLEDFQSKGKIMGLNHTENDYSVTINNDTLPPGRRHDRNSEYSHFELPKTS